MSSNIFAPLIVSLEVTICATLVVALIAPLVAYLMIKYNFKGKNIIEMFLLIPIVLPPSVIGYLILISIGASSPLFPIIEFMFGTSIIFTKYAAILAAIIVSFPIMYQMSKISFLNINKDVIEAALLDKANEFEIIKYIIIPCSFFGLITGLVLSFARAFGEFGATLMVAGNIPNKTQTLSIAIYMAMGSNDRGLATLYVIVMLITSTIFILVTQIIIKKQSQ